MSINSIFYPPCVITVGSDQSVKFKTADRNNKDFKIVPIFSFTIDNSIGTIYLERNYLDGMRGSSQYIEFKLFLSLAFMSAPFSISN